MATQAQIIPEKQTASSIDNSAASKIQERINVLDRKVVFWNNANLLWVLITVVAGVAAFATQYLASVRQKELSGVQAELSAEKDRLLTEKDKQLAADLKSKDLAIAKANDDAAHSNERAAEAIKIAEQERLERVQLQEKIAPRAFALSDIEAISNDLKPFSASLKGRKVKISSNAGDLESSVFAVSLAIILDKAGIEIDSAIGRMLQTGVVRVGVEITGPVNDGAFIKFLSEAIHSRLKTRIKGSWSDSHKETSISVGAKPIAGLPDVIPARSETEPK